MLETILKMMSHILKAPPRCHKSSISLKSEPSDDCNHRCTDGPNSNLVCWVEGLLDLDDLDLDEGDADLDGEYDDQKEKCIQLFILMTRLASLQGHQISILCTFASIPLKNSI